MDGQWWDEAFARSGKVVVGWSGWRTAAALRQGTQELMALLLPHFDKFVCNRPRALLEFGCGWGRLVPYFLERADKYVGVDISEAMIARARTEWCEEKRVWFYTVGEYLPLRLGGTPVEGRGAAFAVKAEIAVSITVLQHCVKDEERHDALKRLTFCEPARLFLYEQSDGDPGSFCRPVTVLELEKELPLFEFREQFSSVGCDGRRHSLFLGERK